MRGGRSIGEGQRRRSEDRQRRGRGEQGEEEAREE